MAYWYGILVWYTGMAYGMAYWNSMLIWYTGIVCWNDTLVWYTGLVYWYGILEWQTDMVCWYGTLVWYAGILCWNDTLVWCILVRCVLVWYTAFCMLGRVGQQGGQTCMETIGDPHYSRNLTWATTRISYLYPNYKVVFSWTMNIGDFGCSVVDSFFDCMLPW